MRALIITGLMALPFFYSHSGEKNRLIVKIKKDKKVPRIKGLKNKRHLFNNIYSVKATEYTKIKQKLNRHQNVLYVESDHQGIKGKLPPKVTLTHSPEKYQSKTFNDPLVGSQWGILNKEAYGVSLFRAHRENNTNAVKKIIVAILDTGIDHHHVDLSLWKNNKEIPGNKIDDDKNGYVDDVYGINTIRRDKRGKATSNTLDLHGHGTHVAGIIGAKQNNYQGVTGVASNVELMSLKTIPSSGKERDVDVIESLIYAAKNGAKIIYAPISKDISKKGKALKEAIHYIGKKYGVLLVIPAGEGGRSLEFFPTYPAAYKLDNVLVVAGTNKYGGLSYFSNYGENLVDLAAPATSIYSSIPVNRYDYMSGTTLGAAMVAGIAAEVLSNYPRLSPSKLKRSLMESVSKMDAFEGRIKSQGRVDLNRALDKAHVINRE